MDRHSTCPPQDEPVPSSEQLILEDRSILLSTDKNRARRYKDALSGKWSKWQVFSTAVEVQVDVVVWLIRWSVNGVEPLLQGIRRRKLVQSRKLSSSKDWSRTVCNGTVRLYTKLANIRRPKWIEEIAKRAIDRKGNSPKLGVDFELWLPQGILGKKK